MKKIKLVLILALAVLSIRTGFTQTTYSSSPASGTYVTCPSGTATSCGGIPVQVAVAQMRVSSISGNQVTFQMKKCAGTTFTLAGTFYVKTNGECGTVVGSQTYAAGASTASVTITMSHCTGSVVYTGTLTTTSTGDRYDAGDITITASTTCSVPSTSSASNIGCNSFTGSWGSVSGATAYNVNIKPCGGSYGTPVSAGSNTSYNFTGLNPCGCYQYQVQAVCGCGTQSSFSGSSSQVNTSTPTVTVTSPSNGSSITVGTATTISWTLSPSGCATGYVLQWVPTSTGIAENISTTVSGSATSYSWTPTSSFTTGAGKIKIYDPNNSPCINNNNQSYSITLNAACSTIPTTSAATNIGCNSFRANWGVVSGATSYNVNIKTCSGSYGTAVSAGNNTYYDFTGLNPCSCYQFQVQAVCASGSSNFSGSSVQVNTSTPTVNITAPSNGSTITAGSATSITWSISPSGCASGYVLQWVPTSTGVPENISTTVSGSATSYSWTPTGSFTTGAGKIKIYDPNNTSCINNNSQTYSITLNPACGIPSPSSTSNITCNSFRGSWASVSGATSYNVNIKTCTGSYGTAVSAGSNTYYDFTGLNPCGCYQYQVQAICSGGSSNFSSSSAQVNTLTPTVTITAPTNGSTITAGTSSTVSWTLSPLGCASGYVLQWVPTSTGVPENISTTVSGSATSYNWTPTGSFNTGAGKIKIYDPNNSSCINNNSQTYSITLNPIPPCNYPTSLSASSITCNGFTATWAASPGAVGYRVNITDSATAYNAANAVYVTTTSKAYTNLDPCKKYKFQVKTICSSDSSVYSPSSSLITLTQPTITITSPANGSSIFVGNSVSITWSNTNGTCITGYWLQWLPNSTGVPENITSSALGAGVTSYTWTPNGTFTTGAGKIKIYDPNRTCANNNSQSYSVTLTSVCAGLINPPNGEPLTATCYLMAQNIIDASQSGTYNASTPLKKQHLAKICFKGIFGGAVTNSLADNFPNPFYDLQNLTDTFHNSVLAMSYLEYTNGIAVFDRDRVYFNPDSSIQRRYALKALMETFNILPQPSSVLPNPFSDVNASDPSYNYIKRAYELSITTQTTFRPTDNITREEAFVMLYRILTNASIVKPTPSPTVYSTFFVPGNYSPTSYNAPHTLQTGNFNHYVKSSFSIPGRNVSLDFAHSYNSYLTELPDELFPQSPIAKGWSHTYNSYIQYHLGPDNNSTADNRLIVVWAEGTIHSYKYQNPNFVCETQGVYDDFTFVNASKIEIKTKAQITYTFERISSTDFTFVLTKISDRNNNTVTVNYQSAPNVTWYGNAYTSKRVSNVQDPAGRSLNFSYNSNNQLQSVTDPLGRNIQFSYSSGQLSRFTDAKGQYTDYTYSTLDTETNLLSRIKLPKGNQIDNTYYQRKLASTKYNNSTTTVAMTPNFSNATNFYSSQVTDPQNVATTSNFNSTGYMSGFTGNGSTLSSAYNIANQPTVPSQIAMDGITTTMQYDTKGNITQITRTGGSITQTEIFTYDAMNNVTSHTDALNHTTTYTYNGTGNLTQTTDALGNQTAISYNSSGQPTQTVNPSGVQTTYGYNTYGNLSQITLPALGISSSTLYDAASRVLKTTNPNSQVTDFTYDANDNLLTNKDALNYTTAFAYDANDNLTTITNAKGKTTTLSYNNNDWVVSESFEGALKQYNYNSDGTLNTYTSPNGTTFSYQYDAQGRLTNDGYATYTYNANNNLNTVTGNGYTITYGYDNIQRITSVQTAYPLGFTKTVNYQYDLANRITRITNPGGFYIDYVYDNANRLTEVRWNGASNPPTAKYYYRNDGLTNFIELGNGTKTYYAYDAAGRMTKLANIKAVGDTISAYDFTLDPNGNHLIETAKEQYASYPTMGAANINYTYNTDNSIATSTNNVFSFDNNGNCVSRTGRTYTFDSKDNILTGSNSTSYTYDALENRRTKTSNGVATGYILDALNNANVLVETDASGSPQWYNVYGQGLVARVKASNGIIYYYHYDYRGSTTAMTDASKNITHKYQYDDFGNLLQQQEATPNPFKYVGKYGVMYEDSMLYYMRARYYDPTIGRFLSEDPIWSVNVYPYADNNPLNMIDGDGKKSKNLASTPLSKFKEDMDFLVNAIFPFPKSNWDAIKSGVELALDMIAKNSGITSLKVMGAIKTFLVKASVVVLVVKYGMVEESYVGEKDSYNAWENSEREYSAYNKWLSSNYNQLTKTQKFKSLLVKQELNKVRKSAWDKHFSTYRLVQE